MRTARRRSALLAIAAVLVGLVAFNTVVGAVRGARLDLTSDRQYTLSQGARALLARLDEPVRLDLYWTRGAAGDLPQIQAHAERVREFLEEIAAASGGRVLLRTVDPEPFSEDEDEARAAGLPALAVDGSGRTLTLGLVVRGATDRREALPYLSPETEPFLEYDVLRAIAAVGRPDRPSVGVVAGMPLGGGESATPGAARGAPVVLDQLRALFRVEMVAPSAEALPEGLDALVLVQPRKMSEALLRAVDAWALAGRPLVVLADPYAETDTSPDARSMGARRGGTAFDLGPLLASWGVEIVPDMVVADRTYATRIQSRGPGGGVRELAYPVWLSVPKAAFAPDDPLLGALGQLTFMSAGSIRALPGATTTLVPLVTTTGESQMVQSLKLGFFGDPEQLIRDFQADGAPKVLAARIEGPARSAFAPAPDAANAGADAAPPAAGRVRILLVADADIVSDETWLVEDRLAGGKRPVSDNGQFVLNAVELMAGDPALAQVHGRGSTRRPFEVVEELRRAAEAATVARERELQEEIRRSEIRIGELQRTVTADGQQALVLSPEQSEEVARLQRRMLDARRELRQVQHDLRASVDALGRRLLVLNAVVWPLLVALAALAWTVRRVRSARPREADR
jgi:ABC-type uncharacterized transport system involved in gliding motility auxiliary subunit